jgi:hypothetical protein
MIQQPVQLDGSFGTLELRPVIKSGVQIDDGRVQTERFILEAKLASTAVGPVPDSGSAAPRNTV